MREKVGKVEALRRRSHLDALFQAGLDEVVEIAVEHGLGAVSYTHLRAHATVLDLVCRLLLVKKKKQKKKKKN